MHQLLLHSLSGQGRHEEALAEPHRHSPELYPAYAGAHELATAVALHGLGRHKEAEEEARRALTACERHLHPDHPRMGEIRALLALIAPACPDGVLQILTPTGRGAARGAPRRAHGTGLALRRRCRFGARDRAAACRTLRVRCRHVR
ncbi:tetratricopeptide repeat protein [Streptomyces erythrochromogenes]|uniref:Tetratricopeptide repeat protein n=1 Tax=Streptomyces erythrochromogenes TaxID=285574 RepID=A0ABZ1Q3R3_9ACTN|nr:tetratricopeptide repeat protein [Streptomyces erythrochromogenes]